MKIELRKLLVSFYKRKKAIMAFNLQNFYQLEAAKMITEKLKLPLIIQFSERYLRFLDEKYGIQYIINLYSNDFIYFHLDHCNDIDFIKYCIDSGFDSVMYDGSEFDVKTNIINTIKVKSYSISTTNCLIEGELGRVSGVEDGFGREGSSYADIDEIEKYIDETKIDLMALGIGNAHGFYENLEELDLNILKEASDRIKKDQLFVLHGGTGLPDKIIKETIEYGVVKINVSTQIKKLTIDILEKFSSENKLYNEILFNNLMVEQLSLLFEKYINKYTK